MHEVGFHPTNSDPPAIHQSDLTLLPMGTYVAELISRAPWIVTSAGLFSILHRTLK